MFMGKNILCIFDNTFSCVYINLRLHQANKYIYHIFRLFLKSDYFIFLCCDYSETNLILNGTFSYNNL
jgi:hypothetical protein